MKCLAPIDSFLGFFEVAERKLGTGLVQLVSASSKSVHTCNRRSIIGNLGKFNFTENTSIIPQRKILIARVLMVC